MQLIRENIFRPLLFTSRTEIDEYIASNEIPYRDDPSNNDENFTRNFLRHKIVPVLNHVYPGLAQRWQDQKSYWLDLQALLETQATVFMDEFLDKKRASTEPLMPNSPFPFAPQFSNFGTGAQQIKWSPMRKQSSAGTTQF